MNQKILIKKGYFKNFSWFQFYFYKSCMIVCIGIAQEINTMTMQSHLLAIFFFFFFFFFACSASTSLSDMQMLLQQTQGLGSSIFSYSQIYQSVQLLSTWDGQRWVKRFDYCVKLILVDENLCDICSFFHTEMISA